MPYCLSHIYDQLLSRIGRNLQKINRTVNTSMIFGHAETSTGPKTNFFREDGVKYNFPNSPFKIDYNKGLDSEDALSEFRFHAE